MLDAPNQEQNPTPELRPTSTTFRARLPFLDRILGSYCLCTYSLEHLMELTSRLLRQAKENYPRRQRFPPEILPAQKPQPNTFP